MRRDLTALISRLVAIDSVNPAFAADGPGEGTIAAYVAEVMGELGTEVVRLDESPARPSVVGVLRGAGGGRSLMLNAHVDTVGVEGMWNPHRPRVEAGRQGRRGEC